MNSNRTAWALFAAATLCATSAFAVGSGAIANEVTSAEQLSELIAVTGSRADPTIVYSNPASLGDLGTLRAAAGLMYYHTAAERRGDDGSVDKMKNGSIFVPHAAAAGAFGATGFGWGLAAVSPYGLATEWEETSQVRYVATKSQLKMVDVTPALSYRFNGRFALGVGADYFSTLDARLEHKVPTGTGADANAKLSGDGQQWGYHAGLLFQPREHHTLALAYHSEVKTKIEGDVELTDLSGLSAVVFGGTRFKTRGRTDLFYPQNVQFGYKYAREDAWEIGLNLAWYDWSSNQELRVQLPDATPLQAALGGESIPLHWRDVGSATLGGGYRLSPAWKLTGGVFYIPAVYPESTFSPAVPDMDKTGVSLGATYSKGPWSLGAVYNPLFYKTTTVHNTVGQDATGLASADISGKYKAVVHIVGVTVAYGFQ